MKISENKYQINVTNSRYLKHLYLEIPVTATNMVFTVFLYISSRDYSKYRYLKVNDLGPEILL